MQKVPTCGGMQGKRGWFLVKNNIFTHINFLTINPPLSHLPLTIYYCSAPYLILFTRPQPGNAHSTLLIYRPFHPIHQLWILMVSAGRKRRQHCFEPINEARIVWQTTSTKVKTEYAIIHLHGFPEPLQEEGNGAYQPGKNPAFNPKSVLTGRIRYRPPSSSRQSYRWEHWTVWKKPMPSGNLIKGGK